MGERVRESEREKEGRRREGGGWEGREKDRETPIEGTGNHRRDGQP